MARKFKVKVGDKTFDVEIEEVTESGPSVAERAPLPRPAREPVRVPTPPAEERARGPTPVAEAKTGVILAPLPGKVVSVKCREGDAVKAGDTVLVLESMKMENEIVAPVSGTVKKISVTVDASVNYGDVLAIIE